MSLKPNFELMADYNQWMNASILDACLRLNAEELNLDRGAFFGSIIATLNHILVGDTIWLTRIANGIPDLKSIGHLRYDKPATSLDALMHTELTGFADARRNADELIVGFVDELSDELLSQILVYKNTKGTQFKKRLCFIIQHFFNHQTHHRGQVSTLLTQAGVDVGVTDLLVRISDA